MSDSSGEGGRPAGDAGAVTSGSGPGRAAPVALDLPGTADGLTRYRASARRWCAAGAAGVIPAVLLAVFSDGSGQSFVPPLAVFGVLSLLTGAVVPLRARRMRRVLASGPWTAHTSVVVQPGLSGAAVVLSGPGPGELLPLTPWTTQWRLDLLNRSDGVLWWCGDPRSGGVLAPSGGTELIRAKPVRGRRARSLVARPKVQGLLTRPAPRQPQTALPRASGLPADAVPAVEARRRRPWWRGVFRWLLLLGCLMVALATSWTVAADDDPQVELKVIGERADGRCEVRWTDPFDGQTRTGPFHCSGYTGLLEGWDTGFVVSYEPFKGDLYDSELRGTPAFSTTDTVALGGLALAAAGIVGGTIRVVRARRLRNRARQQYTIPGRDQAPTTGPEDTGAASRPPAPLSYAAFAAEAASQARLRGTARVKPAEAGRAHPGKPLIWWRVPSLRDIAGTSAALWSLSYGGGVAVLILTMGSDSVSIGLEVVGALIGVSGLFMAWRAVTSGIPQARRLAAAATAPGPRIHRYALLHDGRADGPTLVLFAAEAAPGAAGPDELPGQPAHSAEPSADARPESLLPLLAPGPRKDPWAGLPAPIGTVELRGSFSGRQGLAVAWIDGRPYWPQGICEDIDPAGSQDLGARFGIGPDAV
ncbi:hypothetical protein [Streptomyces sp. NBC_01022]|uniref:hypothetical protein n=1 Tax=Streptomyces sp. NBC_01022 TaxID=2903723 RepID=UPI002DDAC92C|nr:hypothetical protein [Streptomyces sp. NBC_01022]WRZ82769.1 hypothetical protein OG316_22145 [Streptomyces sp. NBC_01022]